LREQDLWLKILFEEAPIGIEIYDHEGNLTYANTTTLNYLGVENVEAFQG